MIEDQNINQLPKGWKWVKLGEVSKLITKGASPKWQGINYVQDSSQVLFVTSENIRENFIDISSPKYLELHFNEKQKRSVLKKGDVLLNIVGASIGRAAIFNLDYNANINQAVSVIRLSDEIMNKFVSYFLNSNKAFSYYNLNKVDVARANLSLADVGNIELALPPIKEQQAIISKIEELLSELDKGMENLLSAQQQLKTYRQSVLKWAFEGKLTNENVKEGELPVGWKWKKLGVMFDFVGGGTPSKSDKDYWNGNIFWASVKDVKGNYLNKTQDTITEKGLKNSASNLAEPGDVILITRISPGKSIISNVKSAINQDLKIAKPKFKTTSKFINYFFNAIERDCLKIASGTTVLGITLNNLNELEIPELNIEEQNNIVQEIEGRLSVADKMEENITQSLQQAEALRQSILKKAFEGRLI